MPSRATWCASPEPDGVPGQRGPAGLPAPGPGVDLGQRAAAQAGAPPGGAQSPALTQLKAGMAAPPFWRPLRSHSPAEVIMAAPCTRPPVHSQSGLRSGSVNSGPTGSAAPPRCPGALLSQSPARAAGSLLAQDPDRACAVHRPACRPGTSPPRPTPFAPPPPPRPARKDAQRAPLFSLTLF